MTEAPAPAAGDEGPANSDAGGYGAAARARRAARLAGRTLRVSWLRFQRDLGFERAAALAYSSLLAIVPAALLAVSVVEVLDASQRLEMADRVLELVFPPEAGEIRQGFHEFLEQSRQVFLEDATGTTVRIFSALLLVYFAGKLLQSVDHVVSVVWGGGGLRDFVRRLGAYWAVITLGPVLLALSFTATALAADHLGATVGGFLARAVPFVVSWGAVFLFYRLTPRTRVRTSAAVAGAIVAGTLWEASKLGLGWYLARPKTFLTTLSFFPAALLWMYVSWVVAVFGLEVAYVVHHRAWRGGPGALPGPRSGAAREALALAAMVEIARAFDDARPCDRAALAERLDAAEDEVGDVLDALIAAGLVTSDAGDLRPARGAAGIRAADAVRAVRGDAAAGAADPAVDVFLGRLAREGARGCGDVTVADLVRGDAGPAPSPPAAAGD